MNAQIIYINRSHLVASRLLAAKKDVRYYLKGILVEANADTTRLVATDGYKFGVFEHRIPDSEARNECESVTVILPPELFANVKPHKTLKLLSLVIDGKTLTLYDGAAACQAEAVDATYPDYRQLLPQAVDEEEAAAYNPEFMLTFKKCSKLLTGNDKMVDILQRGNDMGIVRIPGRTDFIGGIMPLRMGFPKRFDASNWNWASGPLPSSTREPQQAAA